MAVINTLSAPLINRDAQPQVKNDSHVEAGSLRESVGTIETTAGDVASKYRFVQVPSNARISQVLLYSDDQGTTGDSDFGIYQTTENGSAVVDADFFGSAVDVNAAPLNGVDITHESAVFGLEDAEKPLWLALGLSEDPHIMYDIVGTLTEANTSAATLMLKVKYVI